MSRPSACCRASACQCCTAPWRRVLGQPAPPLAAELIVERGLAGSCVVCSRTLDAFCALLGSFAGNVALVLGARGGVYIGGGIVPRLGERFFQSPFRQRFEAKGRFQPYLQAIPTLLITDTLAALNGGVQALAASARAERLAGRGRELPGFPESHRVHKKFATGLSTPPPRLRCDRGR